MSKLIVDDESKRNKLPSNAKNNSLFIFAGSLFFYQLEWTCWFPIKTDHLSDEEMNYLVHFVNNVYPKYLDPKATRDDIASEVEFLLQPSISGEKASILGEFLSNADLALAIK